MTLRPAIAGTRHMAVAGHYLAAQAAFEVLEAGGNAVDAGCAGGIALGVLQSELVNVAGVAPIIIYLAKSREVVTISGLGTWPAATDPGRPEGAGCRAGFRRRVPPSFAASPNRCPRFALPLAVLPERAVRSL